MMMSSAIISVNWTLRVLTNQLLFTKSTAYKLHYIIIIIFII